MSGLRIRSGCTVVRFLTNTNVYVSTFRCVRVAVYGSAASRTRSLAVRSFRNRTGQPHGISRRCAGFHQVFTEIDAQISLLILLLMLLNRQAIIWSQTTLDKLYVLKYCIRTVLPLYKRRNKRVLTILHIQILHRDTVNSAIIFIKIMEVCLQTLAHQRYI